jgi:hypothetical protein
MNVMGNTITGAASGETHWAPKDSQSQAKGQKSNDSYSNVYFEIGVPNLFFY